MCPKKDKKTVKKPADRAKRNRVERQRDSAVDDGIQALMCFLPMHSSPKKYTRSGVLEGVYEEGVKMLQKDAAATAAAATTAAEPTSSNADEKKKEDERNRRKDDDDKEPPAIGQAC